MIDNLAFQLLTGVSKTMTVLRRRIIQLSNYKYSVLINGAQGTGKTTVARAIHRLSDRREHPFIPVDCATLKGQLFRIQTFGANKDDVPWLKSAINGSLYASSGGTIFLKHIDHLEPSNQEALMRVLSELRDGTRGHRKTVQRDVPSQSDIRLMASSESDLAAMVKDGKFRADLHYHIGATRIEIASLVDRKEDIPALIQHFLAKCAIEYGLPSKGLSASALKMVNDFDWPGNVRQLEDAIESALAQSEFPQLKPHDFMPMLASVAIDTDADDSCELAWPTLSELEAQHIRKTLKETRNNLAETALLLGLTEQQLRSKMSSHAIQIS